MRARWMLAALALSGCNLIWGLEDAADRPGGGSAAGNDPGGQPPIGAGNTGGAGGIGAADPSGGGNPSGGDGSGGGACPPDEPAGPGTELTPNGSFELGTSQWVESDLVSFSIVDQGSSCGCRAARVQIDDGYGELRGILSPPAAALVHARARIFAPDTVAAGLLLRVNFNTVEPAPEFPPDASDGTVDGWRTIEADWDMPAGTSAAIVIQADGAVSPPNSEMLVDCVSLVVVEN